MHALTHEFTPIHTHKPRHTRHTHTTPHHTLYSHHTYTHHTHTPHHTTHTYTHTPHIHTHHTYTHHTHTTHTHHTLHSHHTHTTPYTCIDRDMHIILILQVGMKNEGHSSQTVAPVRLSYQSDCHIYKNAKFKEWMLNIPLSGARHY